MNKFTKFLNSRILANLVGITLIELSTMAPVGPPMRVIPTEFARIQEFRNFVNLVGITLIGGPTDAIV